MEERRGKRRVWSEGRQVFIGEVRCLPAFINAAKFILFFIIPLLTNAGINAGKWWLHTTKKEGLIGVLKPYVSAFLTGETALRRFIESPLI